MAMNSVMQRGTSIALACRTFQISETCYRYSPVLSDENEEIADWLERLCEISSGVWRSTKTGSPSSDSIKKRFFKSVICEVLHTRLSIAFSELTYREEI
jgi:hypothetical protein